MDKTFWQNKKVLISGVDGFIGSSLRQALKLKGAQVFGASLSGNNPLDIFDKEALLAFCWQENFDIIIHCAAVDGNAKFKTENAERIFNDNLALATNIIAAAEASKVSDIILISSAEVYSVLNARESDIKASNYALLKLEVEKLFQTWASDDSRRLMILRSSNVYGPGENRAENMERVIPAMIRRAVSDEVIEIWGDGKDKRSFLHIKDLVSGLILAAESDYFKTFYLAGSEQVSVKELAELIISLTGSKSQILLQEAKTSPSYIPNNNDCLALAKFSPRSLRFGLKDMIKRQHPGVVKV